MKSKNCPLTHSTITTPHCGVVVATLEMNSPMIPAIIAALSHPLRQPHFVRQPYFLRLLHLVGEQHLVKKISIGASLRQAVITGGSSLLDSWQKCLRCLQLYSCMVAFATMCKSCCGTASHKLVFRTKGINPFHLLSCF